MEINPYIGPLKDDIPLSAPPRTPRSPFATSLAVADQPEDLIPLERYASDRGLPRELVWSQIQAGRLRVRVRSGTIFILHQIDESAEVNLPSPSLKPDAEANVETVAAVIVEKENPPSIDLKTLLDHLTAAKEEQKELAQLTRTTIEQIRSMSSELVAFKDRMLSEKEAKISSLEERIQRLHDETQTLKKANEDLETLVRTIE